MEILLETKNVDDIYSCIQGILEEEFFNLTGLYECNVPEMDYWIKSQIIDRLSDSSIHFINDRFFESGANLINEYIRIFVKDLDNDECKYIIVENELYIDQNPYIRSNDYKETWMNYDKAFKNFEKWAYNYITKG